MQELLDKFQDYIIKKKNPYIKQVAKDLDLQEYEVYGLLELTKQRGYLFDVIDGRIKKIKPVKENGIYQIPVKNGEVKFIALSDIHYGSKWDNPHLVEYAYELAEKENVDFITNSGDIFEGDFHNKRPDHIYQVKALGLEQLDYMKNYYNYEVYEDGTVKRNGKELKWNLNNKGYPRVGISVDGKVKAKSIHKLVATLYLPDKSNFKYVDGEDISKIDLDKLQVNHKDGNKLNNNVSNLEWCTNLYNRRHAIEHGLTHSVPRGDKNVKARKVKMIGDNTEKTFGSLRSALDYLGKPYDCYSSIAHCCKGDTKTAYGYEWEYIK